MTDLRKSILATLAYSDIFDYPLTEEEIRKWLIIKPSAKFKAKYQTVHGKVQNSKLLASLRGRSGKFKIQNSLATLYTQNIIEKHGGMYHLCGRGTVVKLRKEREAYSKEKLLIAIKTARKLRWIPWIKMIGLTGSLAMNNSSVEDDIDLIIITQNNRLWLVRLLIITLSPFLGIPRRRHGDTRVKDKICFNLFLDETGLTSGARNLYTAHEIHQVKPIYNKNNTYEHLLLANRWTSDYLPNTQATVLPKINASDPKNQNAYYINILIYYTNLFFYQIQRCYMKNRTTNETITLHKAYFHPRPLAREIENQFLTRLKTINKIAIGRVE